MLIALFVSTWVLLVSATTTQCTGADCRVVGGRLQSKPAATFSTLQACETFRAQIPSTAPMVVQYDPPRPLTLRKDLVYACVPGKETP